MTLVDTSVWIDFLHGKTSASELKILLIEEQVSCHPWIYGEIAVGNLGRRRKQILSDLLALPMLKAYASDEVLDFVEKEHLYGQGLSLIDVHLLYAALIEKEKLWTHDHRLAQAAKRYALA